MNNELSYEEHLTERDQYKQFADDFKKERDTANKNLKELAIKVEEIHPLKQKLVEMNEENYLRDRGMSNPDQREKMINFEEWLKPHLDGIKETEWDKWQIIAEKEFTEWAENTKEEAIEEAAENGEEWTNWDDDQWDNWILDQKEKDEEGQWDNFEDWFEEKYGEFSLWQERMMEYYEDEMQELCEKENDQ